MTAPIKENISYKRGSTLYKRMLSFDPRVLQELEREALERGISLQELIRAVVIPDWFKMQAVFRERLVLYVKDRNSDTNRKPF